MKSNFLHSYIEIYSPRKLLYNLERFIMYYSFTLLIIISFNIKINIIILLSGHINITDQELTISFVK